MKNKISAWASTGLCWPTVSVVPFSGRMSDHSQKDKYPIWQNGQTQMPTQLEQPEQWEQWK
jgi:hypothetical protein